MRSRFPCLLLSVIVALILSACATTGEDEARPPAAASEMRAPPVSTLPQDVPDVAPAPAGDAPAAREVPPASVEHPAEPAPPPAIEPPPVPGGETAPPPAPAEVAVPAREAPPASPFVFNVVSATKDSSHPFYGVGHRQGFVVNGVQGKPLVAVRDKTYSFRVNAGIQHDFYLSTSEVGWGAAAYTDGVAGQFIYEGVVTFKPNRQTPDLLYYQCRNHRNMGGPIYVVNEGEENKPIAELRAARGGPGAGAQAAAPAQQRTVTEQQLRQKIQFADMFINQSPAAGRIRESGNAMAIELHRVANENFEGARAALSAGDQGEALRLVEDAMRLMSEASLQAPQADTGEAERARFEELYEGVQGFEASYRRNYEQMVKTKGRQNVRAVNLNQIRDIMTSARSLADDGKYNEAISMLGGAQDTLTSALTEMLADQTIVHELKFETPRDEYEYELSRYLGYEGLVPLAIQQRQPAEQTLKMMMQFVDRAKEVKALSEPEAAKGNYEEAILMLQGATSNIQRALQAVGVR